MRRPPPLALALALALLPAGCAPEEPPDFKPVRFLAVGDTGEGNSAQYEVAAVMEQVCEAQGCNFALLLGDNFYDIGVESVDDAQWQTKFIDPYQGLGIVFYAVLGNHDYGSGTNLERAEAQIAYHDHNPLWYMPDHQYEHTHQNVQFLAFDTQAIMYENLFPELVQQQVEFLRDLLSGDNPFGWRVAYGHHPYRSNGEHGNAGSYEGADDTFPMISGTVVEEVLRKEVCGKVDLYLSGHDHDQEWMEEDCKGTELVVSGAGSKLRDFETDQPTRYAEDQIEGFAWLEIHNADIRIQFWNRDGSMAFEGGWTKTWSEE